MKHEDQVDLTPILKKLQAHKWDSKIEVVVMQTPAVVFEMDGQLITVRSRMLVRETDITDQLIEEIQYDLKQMAEFPRYQFAKKYSYVLHSIAERFGVDSTTLQDTMSSRIARYAKHIAS